MLRSPREAQLEAENQQLRAELARYKSPYHPDLTYLSDQPIDDEVQLDRPLVLDLRCIAKWDVLGYGELSYNVIGRTSGIGGDAYSIGYFVDKATLYTARDRVSILGSLHERVVRDLAKDLSEA